MNKKTNTKVAAKSVKVNKGNVAAGAVKGNKANAGEERNCAWNRIDTACGIAEEINEAAMAVNDITRFLTRVERWVEVMPEAITKVCSCQAMKDGELLPIPKMEEIDGRKIETIILAILKAKFLDDVNGNCSYTKDEDYYPAYRMRQRAVNDAQFAMLHLLDFRAYVPQERAEEFYSRFYRPGDENALVMARRAIRVAMDR